MNNDGSDLIIPDDYVGTLRQCQGFYQCPYENGKPVGLLVGYAGTYRYAGEFEEHNYVGDTYYNFSRADQYPAVLTYFAEAMARNLTDADIRPTVILGAPMAGLKFSQEVARLLGCRHIFAEKVAALSDDGKSLKTRIALARYEINPGDRVVIGEELVNNCSTTAQLIELVRNAGGHVIGIMCAINRSSPFIIQYAGIPVMSVIGKETPQYKQDDPLVAGLVRRGSIIWKPKIRDWPRLLQVMKNFKMI
ncbi:MAG: phosphoribosyltransferase family protein [Candidatus Moranbacteria bacterium]|nr:phosphoribosyltransferase family protein [Candidatus Moranbacteria bacterium]